MDAIKMALSVLLCAAFVVACSFGLAWAGEPYNAALWSAIILGIAT